MKKKMEKALNNQVNAELYSSYLYLAMESYFQSVSLSGCATWMRGQVQEEMFHGIKLYDYVHERGGRVQFEAIAKPETQWESPLAAFEHILAHEQKVTQLINDLIDVALDVRDHAAKAFLDWFIMEQVEEEATVGEIVNRLRLIGNDSSGLFLLDSELGKRVFTLPPK
ncbi:MAG: ferritin [Proteobacteria bacterium]|nr:ferritin [Pseudomonadota bacterium]MBU1139879.1 ferritin [Pseudomonadota bacterium]MBU1234845.1 ferritin [Pseudomonadota bacterium]MBU1418511.1 ferritin [Pseudomonadota bacterium]MBU1454882.1 ferritin [Pseudomonadota bacterium]